MTTRVVLVTGAAKRIGAAIAGRFHEAGYRVLLHCRESATEAEKLAAALCRHRPASARVVYADLETTDNLESFITTCAEAFGRLDVLVNNAAVFYPTPLESLDPATYDSVMNINLKAPLFLAKYARPHLGGGAIVNLIDIYGDRPLRRHLAYSISKAGLVMLTRALALELAPDIRVNGIAPGAITWPGDEAAMTDAARAQLLARIPMARLGGAEAIAGAALFLARDAAFTTGQIIAVDGGQSLGWPQPPD